MPFPLFSACFYEEMLKSSLSEPFSKSNMFLNLFLDFSQKKKTKRKS